MVHSPLARAAETAAIVWGDRRGHVTAAPSLREIDLHSLQGVLKTDALSHLGALAHGAWKGAPANFELDRRRPVVDLWGRAAAAWGVDVLPRRDGAGAPRPPTITRRLVVAHNAVNQALIGTALGLPPSSFRRVVQGNGCATEVFWSGGGGGAASSSAAATVTCLNVGPGAPRLTPAPQGGGLVLLLAATDDGHSARGAPSWLAATRGAAAVVATPDAPPGAVAIVVAEAGVRRAVVVQARDVLPTAAAAAAAGRGVIVVVVAPPAVVAAALAAAMGAPVKQEAPGGSAAPPLFTLTPGGVSVIEVPPGDVAARRAALRCANWVPGGVASVIQGVAGV